MTADQLSEPKPARRRVIEMFLGGGLLASFASFIYPVLRYLVPPAVADLGGDETVAAKLTELKPNSGKDFPVWQSPRSDGAPTGSVTVTTSSGTLTSNKKVPCDTADHEFQSDSWPGGNISDHHRSQPHSNHQGHLWRREGKFHSR